MLDRKNGMAEPFLLLSVVGLVYMLNQVSIDSARRDASEFSHFVSDLLFKLFLLFTLLCFAWTALKRTRFAWLLKGLHTVILCALTVAAELALTNGGIQQGEDAEVVKLVRTFYIWTFLVLSLFAHYDFKLTLIFGVPSVAVVMYQSQAVIERIDSDNLQQPGQIVASTLSGIAIGVLVLA